MIHGLNEREISNIIKASEGLPEIEEVVIFGSRAKGNFKKASDIDLAIKGKRATDITVKRLSGMLNEEMPLPYFFDVVHYESISNSDLIDHIKRVGTVIYRKQSDNGI
jgi:predicted nucleotidyltransferase